MSFILPLLGGIVLFGTPFDLRKYEIRPFEIYGREDVSEYVQVTDISDYKSEYVVLDSITDARKAFGLDAATSLKTMVNSFPFQFRGSLDLSDLGLKDDTVSILIKLSLRTVNESLPYDTPTRENWKIRGPASLGTHYVKSIAYGADLFVLLSKVGNSEQHTEYIRKSISSVFGKSGIFDFSFKEKFSEILREHGPSYLMSSFGTVQLGEKIPPLNLEDLDYLRENFEEIVRSNNNGKGKSVSYEMQSLSFIDSAFPFVDINRDVMKVLETVELKYEDLLIAKRDVNELLYSSDISIEQEICRYYEIELFQRYSKREPSSLFVRTFFWSLDSIDTHTVDFIARVCSILYLAIICETISSLDLMEEFYTALDDIINVFVAVISRLDITTTSGDVSQFDEALDAYGDRSSTTKYRVWLTLVKKNL